MQCVCWSMMYITVQKDFGYKIGGVVSQFSKSVQVSNDAHEEGFDFTLRLYIMTSSLAVIRITVVTDAAHAIP